MFGAELRSWILSLNEHEAVALVRSLLIAETSRVGAPIATVRMTGNIHAKDEGVDGRTDFPDQPSPAVPLGPQTWQIKATSGKPDIASELEKPGVVADLNSGRDYVLVWTRDTAPLARAALEKEIPAAVQALKAERTGKLFGTEDLERLANIHPAVVQALGGPTLLGLPLALWAEHLHSEELPFVSDGPRDTLIEAIRNFAGSTEPATTHLHLYGDTGVGKSRLVLHALAHDSLRERVFACSRSDDVDQQALQRLVTADSATAILLVDDVAWQDAQRLADYASAARGRLRLVTVGERPDRESRPGRNSLDIRPLEPGVIARLASSVSGIDSDEAELIANLAEGYPKLAVELGKAVADAEDPASVLQLVRTADVHELLRRMLPDEMVRQHISHLAIVDRLGFEEGLEFETDQLCDAFGLDVSQFRAAIQVELDRFVSQAGRYRLATPRAFAVWLVGGLIRQSPSAFADRVVALPDQLFEAFRRQVEILGEDPYIAELLTEVIARKGDTFHAAHEVTSEFARLLEATSYALPELAGARIKELISAANEQQLLEVSGQQRRSFVWALSHLLWFSTTFTDAAGSLFRLALSENETYGNNASGIIVGAFGVFLGGTEVPLEDRLNWLRGEYPMFGQEGAQLAIRCAAASLQWHETRMGGWRGARLQPNEWRPNELEGEHRARGEAIAVLGEILNEHPELEDEIAKVTAESFRGLVTRGMVEELLLFFEAREWGHKGISEIVGALRESLHYEKDLPSKIRDRISTALASYETGNLEDRLAVVLATPYWDLSVGVEEKMSGPEILPELASELIVTESAELVTKYSRADAKVDETTTHAFYQALGESDDPRKYAFLALDHDASLAARTGYVIGRHRNADSSWVSEKLIQWIEDDEFAKEVSIVIHQMPASTHTLTNAIAPVESGRADLSTLNRLMLGGWIKPLSAEDLGRMLRQYAERELGYSELDAALHMLLFWLEDSEEKIGAAPIDLAVELISRTADFPDNSGGLPYVRKRLLDLLPLPPSLRLEILLRALAQPAFATEEEIQLLVGLAAEDPPSVVGAVLQLLLSDREGWSLYLSRAHLISRIVEATGLEPVLDIVSKLSNEDKSLLLRHVDFTAGSPDPFLVAMLDSSSDPVLAEEATRRYLYPGEVVVGSYANYLQRRLDRLREWASSTTTSALRDWANSLIPTLETEIKHQQLRESEENLG